MVGVVPFPILSLEIKFTPKFELKPYCWLNALSVAASNIPCGTVLAVDRPIAALLNPGNPADVFMFCVHCLRKVGRGRVVPCRTCSAVVFCSRFDLLETTTQNAQNLYETMGGVWPLGIHVGPNGVYKPIFGK